MILTMTADQIHLQSLVYTPFGSPILVARSLAGWVRGGSLNPASLFLDFRWSKVIISADRNELFCTETYYYNTVAMLGSMLSGFKGRPL